MVDIGSLDIGENPSIFYPNDTFKSVPLCQTCPLFAGSEYSSPVSIKSPAMTTVPVKSPSTEATLDQRRLVEPQNLLPLLIGWRSALNWTVFPKALSAKRAPTYSRTEESPSNLVTPSDESVNPLATPPPVFFGDMVATFDIKLASRYSVSVSPSPPELYSLNEPPLATSRESSTVIVSATYRLTAFNVSVETE